MRKTLLTLTALAGLAGAGAFTSASATALPSGFDPAMVQTAQYYHGWRDGDGWRGHRHHEWERHRHWVEHHRWHHGW